MYIRLGSVCIRRAPHRKCIISSERWTFDITPSFVADESIRGVRNGYENDHGPATPSKYFFKSHGDFASSDYARPKLPFANYDRCPEKLRTMRQTEIYWENVPTGGGANTGGSVLLFHVREHFEHQDNREIPLPIGMLVPIIFGSSVRDITEAVPLCAHVVFKYMVLDKHREIAVTVLLSGNGN
ncbi:hypothetical protein ARMGADRAFT_1040416 [Armillaria gallica]|uniref:Uncharacterized protein n=1 Tax=Armillaria gallica TaxID=47427 RepID=A0A2H3CA34_ARMGA|nr:hypothetical protein ARMGADRAFT_1040416 [Armillaria gallica]